MAVIRVNHTDNYTVMSNYHLRDRTLSLKAKGLLSQMLSLPPTWDYTVSGLVAINQEKQSAITSTLKELQKHGYLIVTKKMPNETDSGRIEYIYDIYEQPPKQGVEKQGIENQGVEFQGVEIQEVENQAQLNKEESSKEELKKEKKVKSKRFTPPTLEEVKEYCKERNKGVDAERFIDFYTAKGWMVGRNPMKDWKAAVRTWERNQYSKPMTGPNGIKLSDERDELDDEIDRILGG